VNFLYHTEHLHGGTGKCLFGSVFLPDFKFSYFMGNIFISPALYKNEKKNAKAFIFFSSTFLGVLFGYYIVIPMSVNFVATFKVSDLVLNQFTLDSYSW
jgi:Sec-independent protein secretion pathway component TatC